MYAIFKPGLMKKAQKIYKEYFRFERSGFTLSIFRENKKISLILILDCVINYSIYCKKHLTGLAINDVLCGLGYRVVKMWLRSSVVGMKRAMVPIEALHITALLYIPVVVLCIARHMKKANISPADTPVQQIITLGELTTPVLMRSISEVWNTKVCHYKYASQESSILAVSADERALSVIPCNNFYDVIDPYTGVSVDTIGEQITRELVITLTKEYLALDVDKRNIFPSEWLAADECFLSGAGVEIAPIPQIEHPLLKSYDESSMRLAIYELYMKAVQGQHNEYAD
ncbi:hypothetical protein [Dickeya zeae]|uniref:hypothetical protein n=1 Tax=Dickeya zeae TaxID=204042 RepID=UPI0003A66F36|nr:hypothetical protein [Dickeya zeae]